MWSKWTEILSYTTKNQQNRPLIFFLFATTPQNLKKKILAYLFFLLFAPTLIPEAFQIKTVCSKKIITKVLKKLSVNDQNYFLLISHTLERNKPSHSNQFYCKKKTTTALRRKSKSFHFCNELLLSVPNPCIQNPYSALPMFSALKLLQHSVGCPLFSIIHEITVLRQLTISIFG